MYSSWYSPLSEHKGGFIAVLWVDLALKSLVVTDGKLEKTRSQICTSCGLRFAKPVVLGLSTACQNM